MSNFLFSTLKLAPFEKLYLFTDSTSSRKDDGCIVFECWEKIRGGEGAFPLEIVDRMVYTSFPDDGDDLKSIEGKISRGSLNNMAKL